MIAEESTDLECESHFENETEPQSVDPLPPKPANFSNNDYPLCDMTVYDSHISKTPLYDGAKILLLEALVQHFSWFTEHPGISYLMYFVCSIKYSPLAILYLRHMKML